MKNPLGSDPAAEIAELRIVTLKFGSMRERLFLQGENTEAANKRYEQALEGLGAVGDRCQSPEEFVKEAVEHFKGFGFTPTRH